jgi:hypothetical protein
MPEETSTQPQAMWAALIPIIARYGLPLGEKLWQLSQTAKDPTQADWDALKALSLKTPADYLAEAAAGK